MKKRRWPQILVHTGQHYDPNMAGVFFEELGMPQPDIYLRVGSDNHARQTARIMTAFDTVCDERRPGLVVVAGDVNSTVAAALVLRNAGFQWPMWRRDCAASTGPCPRR